MASEVSTGIFPTKLDISNVAILTVISVSSSLECSGTVLRILKKSRCSFHTLPSLQRDILVTITSCLRSNPGIQRLPAGEVLNHHSLCYIYIVSVSMCRSCRFISARLRECFSQTCKSWYYEHDDQGMLRFLDSG